MLLLSPFLALSSLGAVQRRKGGGHFEGLVGLLISGRLSKSMEGVIGFHLISPVSLINKYSRRNRRSVRAIYWFGVS